MMDGIESLAFDAEAMLEGLRPWVECESPSNDAAAVNRMMDLVASDFTAAGAKVERLPGAEGFSDILRVTLWKGSSDAGGILILGHFDTVHPVGTLDNFPWRREGNRCFGPGILDMKAGNYMVLEAFRKLKAAGIEPCLPVIALFTGDEEVGSPKSRHVIEAEASKHRYVLVTEPARPDGSVVTGRYAISRMKIETKGLPTHAGNGPRNGVSAIREMAELIAQIEDLSTDEATISVGIVRGGEFTNCVAASCYAEALIMSRSTQALEDLWQRVFALSPRHEKARIIVTRGLERPIWISTGAESPLYLQAKQLAVHLGFELFHTVSGGGSDANFTGALGKATLDGLGARGALLHTQEEHILVDSLVERGKLLAALIATLK